MRGLLDPRWHWLFAEAGRLYAQLDPGETPISLTLMSVSAEGEILCTVSSVDGQMTRHLINDYEEIQEQAREVQREHMVDLTPGNEAP